MDWDDVSAKLRTVVTVGADLTALSVDELTARIADLKSEIARVELELASKRARVTAADALFK